MPVESGDVAGLVDVGGGRRLYLECRGTGSPMLARYFVSLVGALAASPRALK